VLDVPAHGLSPGSAPEMSGHAYWPGWKRSRTPLAQPIRNAKAYELDRTVGFGDSERHLRGGGGFSKCDGLSAACGDDADRELLCKAAIIGRQPSDGLQDGCARLAAAIFRNLQP
jgi:hypothetical protein